VAVGETAVPHRQEGFNLLIPSVWLDPADTEQNKAWTRETHAAFSEHLVERRWLNYLTDDQGSGAVRSAYGPNWDRLVQVKTRVDPENVFHRNQNIPPA
jgi:FAD/FMN-containing dehydrogenase